MFDRKSPAGILLLALAAAVVVACAGCEDETVPASPGPIIVTNDFGSNDPGLYVALGDSITRDGQEGASPSYPERLSVLLDRLVVNEGLPGERSAGGRDRVDDVLAQYKPGYLLILYGANDIILERPTDWIVNRLRDIIGYTRAHGTIPVLATMLPMAGPHSAWAPIVPEVNVRIRELASEQSIPIVDLEAVFAGCEADLLLADGLHPTAAGNAAIAQAFYDVLSRIAVVEATGSL